MMKLHVTPRDFAQLKEWSLLPEPEFVGNVYQRYPWLRDAAFGEEIKVIVDWQPRLKRVFDNWPDGSIVRPHRNEDGTYRY